MGLPSLIRRTWAWVRRRDVTVWYDTAYRLPLSGLHLSAGMEPRRADYVAWWLRRRGAVSAESFRAPRRVTYAELSRVHTAEYLESLSRPETLARIFAVDPSDVPVDELMNTIRLACGATLEAARETLRTRAPALNLLGGFHHAGPATGGGFCPVNDVAVAVAALRADGFASRVVVLDLDAHPPDGIAQALKDDPRHWIGSISGSDWGQLEGVDETVLPAHAGDDAYLAALRKLLDRMPRCRIAFVIAGGDVLAGDRMGKLGLSLDGVRQRDLLVASALEGRPSVWLPAGGYTRQAWRAFAGTGMAVAIRSREKIPEKYDPLSERFAGISASMTLGDLGDASDLSAADIEEALGMRPQRQRLLLGFYTASGIENALFQYGIADQAQRLGYGNLRVELDASGPGERIRIHGEANGEEHLLCEAILEKRRVIGFEVLFIHWLLLRNPRAQFSERRPRLPGQEAPGLGLAREAGEMLGRMAVRLRLRGVAFRPAHYHTAFSARHDFTFVDPARQGRFEAMVRDLAGVSLLEATEAVTAGKVTMNGAPYAWEADEMIYWIRSGLPLDREAVELERARVRFELPR
jgi:acetoin utilization deacetylase AcuC-like enzyme